MNQTILNSWQDNGTLPMNNQMQIMMQEIKLSIIKKCENLIFVISMMLTF